MDLLQIALGMGLATTIAEDEKKKRERNIIEIPENATNGDMIKALFPQVETKPSVDDSFIKVCYLDSNEYEEFELFYTDWWNAPYKKESEE